MDPKKFRPKDGWALVLDDQRREKSGSIYLPGKETGVEKVTEGSGVVIRLGPGKKNSRLGLEEGQHIAYRGYLKYANPIETDERWPDGQAKQFFLMDSNDIVAIMQPGVEVGVFSGRPQVPAKE